MSPAIRAEADCPDCGLPFATCGDHDCPAVDPAERVYDRLDTTR